MTDNELSIEARVVAGVWWGKGMNLTELSFDRPWIIHPRTRKGLDELVEHGFLTVERFNEVSDKLVWRPTEEMKRNPVKVSMDFLKANSFPITTE